MTEIELIKEIKKLKEIKPRKDWALFAKTQILGEEKRYTSLFFLRPVYAGLVLVFVLFGVFGFSQNSLPGDLLYPLKKIVEKTQAVFVSEDGQTRVQLELANKRLEELTRIAQSNEVRKLAPAIEEFQANVSEAAKKIAKAKKSNFKEIVQQAQKLEENKKKIEALGIVVGETEEFKNAFGQLVENQIKDLETRTLSENQQKLFDEAKEDYQAGDYGLALEKIWLLSQPQGL